MDTYDGFRNQYIWFHLNDTIRKTRFFLMRNNKNYCDMPKTAWSEKMNKNLLLGILAIFVISIASLGAVLAYRGNADVQGSNYDADVHEQLEAAMDAGDYDAWIQIREDNDLPMRGRMFQVITEDNFGKYVELHEANLAGDTEKADAIKAELGLGQGMQKHGTSQGKGLQKNVNSGSLQQNFIDADNDGLCDTCGNARR